MQRRKRRRQDQITGSGKVSAVKERSRIPLKKRLTRLLLVACGALLILVVGTGILAKMLITKDFLIEEIEASISSEVSIADVQVSLLSLPAKVTLRDVSFAPKGSASMDDAPVKIEEASLSVSIWGLLRKHVHVTNITIRGADITATYHEDGSNSLEKLFESPDGKRRDDKEDDQRGGFNVFDQEEFVATLGGLSIENSRLLLTLESMGLRLQCLDFDLELSSIKVDPKRLAETNTAKLNMSSHVKIDSVKGWEFGELFLSGQSTARVFNPETGDVEPDVSGDFSLSDESWLNSRVPFITKAWNHLRILEKVGVRLAKLPEQATFGRSEAIAAHYHLGKVTVKKPLSVWVGDWEFAALEKSWLNTKSDQHEIYGELLASEKSSTHFRNVIFKGIELLPENVQEYVGEDIDKGMFVDNRLQVRIKSTGEFSDPKIRPVGVIMDLTEAAKNAAKRLIKEKTGGLLDGLLGGDDDE